MNLRTSWILLPVCSVQIPHLYRTVARGSPTRQQLFERRGLFQAPYLEVIVFPFLPFTLSFWILCAAHQPCTAAAI